MTTQKFLKVLIILITLNLSGCITFGKPININVIDRTDFFSVKAGSKLTTPSGEIIPLNKDGRFLTNGVLQRLSDAKVNKIR